MNEPEHDIFLQKMYRQIQCLGMFAPSDRWLLAVSGGPDSMAMLHGLLMLRKEGQLELAGLHIAHLNHQLRGDDSDADAEFVRQQARQLQIEVTVDSIDVAGAARESGESIEVAARRLRYSFLAGAARANNCNKIALGHNSDDNIETILHRILRGTGIRGLAGMPEVRGLPDTEEQSELTIVRPLLSTPRCEIEAFVKQHDIKFRLDRSNLSDEYTRNRIRNELLPLLREKYNPEIGTALLQLGRIAGDFSKILSSDAIGTLHELTLKREHDCLTLDAMRLAERSRILQAEIVHQGLLALRVPLRRIGFKQINAILDLINEQNPAKRVQLPFGWNVGCRDGELNFYKTEVSQSSVSSGTSEPIALLVPGTTVPERDFIWFDVREKGAGAIREFHSEIITGTEETLETFMAHKSLCEEMIDPARIEGPLVLRSRKKGDRFLPLGAPGEKKIGDFFTDVKVPAELRDRVGLVCDHRGIVWITGLRLAERVSVGPDTQQILKLIVR
jgi:tRNA(Ile)-lysidine synthase